MLAYASVVEADGLNQQCTQYNTVCTSYICQNLGSTQTCQYKNVQYNYNTISQNQIIFGTCTTGSGSCYTSPQACTAQKYWCPDPTMCWCDSSQLVCTDSSNVTGCT